MDWERFDRLGNRTQILVTFGGYLAGAYALWPKGVALFDSARGMNWMAVLALVFVGLGGLSTASQLGWLRPRKGKSAERMPNQSPSGEISLPSDLRAALGIDTLPTSSANLRRIVNKTYENENVPLDGFEYVGCKFANVKFVFNGGNYAMHDCILDKSFNLQTANQIVLNTISLLGNLDFLNPKSGLRYDQARIPNNKV